MTTDSTSINTDEPAFTITVEQLKANGWQINETGFPYLAEKDLTEAPDAKDKIKLIVHAFYNGQTFALLLPGGSLVNIGPYTIEELNLFERMILSVE